MEKIKTNLSKTERQQQTNGMQRIATIASVAGRWPKMQKQTK